MRNQGGKNVVREERMFSLRYFISWLNLTLTEFVVKKKYLTEFFSSLYQINFPNNKNVKSI